MISFQSFDRQRQFYLRWYYLCDQAPGFERSKFKNESYEKNYIKLQKSNWSDLQVQNTVTKFTNLNVALPILHTRLLSFRRSEVLIIVIISEVLIIRIGWL